VCIALCATVAHNTAQNTTTTTQPFYGPFSDDLGEPVPARKKPLDFMVQGEINRGRHIDHSAGRHYIRTNQCPTPQSPPHIFYEPDALPAANQQCQSTEGTEQA